MGSNLRGAVATLVACAAITVAHPCHASALAIDWGHFITESDAWVRHSVGAQHEQAGEAAPRSTVVESHDPDFGSGLLDMSPRISIVAHDWGSTHRLLGDHLGLTDSTHLSRSFRMVVSRVRLGEGRIVPFAQVGIGQWRVDRDVVLLPSDTEFAGQIGTGLEAHVVRGWDLALETDTTVLYRQEHEPQNVAAPHIFRACFASRIAF